MLKCPYSRSSSRSANNGNKHKNEREKSIRENNMKYKQKAKQNNYKSVIGIVVNEITGRERATGGCDYNRG